MDSIYLDHNATTPLLPEVAGAIHQCLRARYGNPASQHAAGRRARQALEDAREAIARMLGADLASHHADRLIFTSGGTEANNLAVLGLATGRPAHAVVSAIEHPSVAAPAHCLEQRGWRVDRLPCNAHGVVCAEELPALLRPDTRLVSVMLGNNETGVLQPVLRLAEICNAAGVPLHTDAVQVVGKLKVDFRGLGAAAMSASAHKFHGPVGVGVLLVRRGVELEPQMAGGFQQQGLRPGTEPVALAVGMQRALECCHGDWPESSERVQALRDRFESMLLDECPRLVVNGAGADRLPHTSNVAFPGVDGQALLMALDLAGVACSYGSACASGSPEPSPALVAMGLPQALLQASLRFSLGRGTTAPELAEAARRITKIYKDLQTRAQPRKMAGTARKEGVDSV
ncbi:MAG: cysteine desulfurase family protein [Pirellulales bacterium]